MPSSISGPSPNSHCILPPYSFGILVGSMISVILAKDWDSLAGRMMIFARVLASNLSVSAGSSALRNLRRFEWGEVGTYHLLRKEKTMSIYDGAPTTYHISLSSQPYHEENVRGSDSKSLDTSQSPKSTHSPNDLSIGKNGSSPHP